MRIYRKLWILNRFLITDMGMSSRFFKKKDKIRKIKISIKYNVMQIKKLKKIKN